MMAWERGKIHLKGVHRPITLAHRGWGEADKILIANGFERVTINNDFNLSTQIVPQFLLKSGKRGAFGVKNQL